MTPKTIIISFLAFAMFIFAATEAMTPKVSDLPSSQIQSLKIQDEITKTQSEHDQAQTNITAAQKIVDLNVPVRDNAKAKGEKLRASLLELTRGAGVRAGGDTPNADVGTSGKNQPTL